MRYRVIFTDGTVKIADVDMTFEGKSIRQVELIEDSMQVMELKNEKNKLENTIDVLLREINHLRMKDNEDNKRKQYGKYKGHYKWDLTKEWLSTTNDNFYKKYGFNYVPYDTKGLYEDCRLFLGKSVPMDGPIIKPISISFEHDINDITKQIHKQITKTGLRNRF